MKFLRNRSQIDRQILSPLLKGLIYIPIKHRKKEKKKERKKERKRESLNTMDPVNCDPLLRLSCFNDYSMADIQWLALSF